jgi:hypothetical protein
MKLATLLAASLLVSPDHASSAQPVDTLRSAKEAVAAQLRVDDLGVRGRATKRAAVLGTLIGVVVGSAAGLYVGEVI